MITRQLNFKTLQRIRNSRLTTHPTPSELHSLNNAQHLFDETPQPNAAPVNRSMLNNIHRNLPATALGIFTEQIQQCGSLRSVDEVTVALAVKACKGDPKFGCQIQGFAVSSGFISHVSVSNSLMSMYIKGGRFDSAVCIFEGMCYTDVVSWNTVLSGFRTSEGALSFAQRMHSNGVGLDPVTYSTVQFLLFVGSLRILCLEYSCILSLFKAGLDCEIFVDV